jgi:hypothetical protein
VSEARNEAEPHPSGARPHRSVEPSLPLWRKLLPHAPTIQILSTAIDCPHRLSRYQSSSYQGVQALSESATQTLSSLAPYPVNASFQKHWSRRSSSRARRSTEFGAFQVAVQSRSRKLKSPVFTGPFRVARGRFEPPTSAHRRPGRPPPSRHDEPLHRRGGRRARSLRSYTLCDRMRSPRPRPMRRVP